MKRREQAALVHDEEKTIEDKALEQLAHTRRERNGTEGRNRVSLFARLKDGDNGGFAPLRGLEEEKGGEAKYEAKRFAFLGPVYAVRWSQEMAESVEREEGEEMERKMESTLEGLVKGLRDEATSVQALRLPSAISLLAL